MAARRKKAPSYIPAPLVLRTLAGVIDLAFLAGILYFVFKAIPEESPNWVRVLIFVGIFAGYNTLCLWLNQQTLGKALMGLRVTRLGKEPDLVWALGRSSVGYLLVDVFGIGSVAAFFNPGRQALHDFVFKSAVTIEDEKQANFFNVWARFLRFANGLLEGVEGKTKTRTYFLLQDFRELFFVRPVEWVQHLVGTLSPVSAGAAPAGLFTFGKVTGVTASAAIAAAALSPPGQSWLEASKQSESPESVVVVPAKQVSSDFESGDDGWSLVGAGEKQGTDYEVQAIRTIDRKGFDSSIEAWYWQAPRKYLKDKSGFYDRQLSFKLKTENWSSRIETARDVALRSENFELTYNVPEDQEPKAGEEFASICVPLSAGASAKWRVTGEERDATEEDMRRVLHDLDQILIRGEYGFNKTGWLDLNNSEAGWLKDVKFGAVPSDANCS